MKTRLLAALLALALAPVARAESRRWGSFELGAGPYLPDVDSEFSASPGPYEQVFGTKQGWMFRAGASMALLSTPYLVLEAGVKSGFMRRSGRGQITDPATPGVWQPSGDRTALSILPTSATLTLRVDWLVEKLKIPISLYGRGALERYNWWVTDGGGHSVERGATNGWSATAGAAFLLDFFDRGLARELDEDTGVNHTYVFFDATTTRIDDFGADDSWDLSADRLAYAAGLLFVF